MTDLTARTMFTDLPADRFPFTIELLDPATRKVLWSVASGDGPAAIQVPAARELGAEHVVARVTFADGTVEESDGPHADR